MTWLMTVIGQLGMMSMDRVLDDNMMHILWWWQCTLHVYPMVMVPYVAELDDVVDTLMTKLYDIVAAVRIYLEPLYQHINPRWSSPKLQKSLSKPWLKFAWCKFKIQGIKYARMQYEQSVDTYSNEAYLLQDLCSDDDINTNKVGCSWNSWSLMMLMVHTVWWVKV